jgi:predicted site-specific integrase-resolvase
MPDVSVREAAAILGVAVTTIHARIYRGQMAVRRSENRLLLISEEEIERWRKLGRRPDGRPRKDA